MDVALLFFGLLWGLLGNQSGASPRPAPPPPPPSQPGARWRRRPQLPAAPSTPSLPAATAPWPQVAPTGLPPFPGPAWEPDEPPPVVVQQRAGQLLSKLWATGAGTFQVEQTAGRWIAYKATPMGSKKGVVAYRQKRASASAPAAAPTRATTPRAPSSSPASTGQRRTLRLGMQGGDVAVVQRILGIPQTGNYDQKTFDKVDAFQRSNGLKVDGVVGPETWAQLDKHPVARAQRASAPAPAPAPRSPAGQPTALDLPILRHGMGAKPAEPVREVFILQQKLGIAADGRFWNETRTAVKAFQKKKGLKDDGVVGPATWTKLFEVRA